MPLSTEPESPSPLNSAKRQSYFNDAWVKETQYDLLHVLLMVTHLHTVLCACAHLIFLCHMGGGGGGGMM